MDQREKNMVFLNLMLTTFVEEVIRECAAKRDDIDAQTEHVRLIKEDISTIIKNRLPVSRLTCKKDDDCGDNMKCNVSTGVCEATVMGLAWS